jgi:hypothetical protein
VQSLNANVLPCPFSHGTPKQLFVRFGRSFNPRPREGGDLLRRSIVIQQSLFQSTPPLWSARPFLYQLR